MKTIKILTVLLFISLTTFAQPSALKGKTLTRSDNLSIEIKYQLITDTVAVNFIVYDKEGYLKKQTGKLVRTAKVFENKILQPELQSATYFNDKWETIKPEDIYDIKTAK